MQIISGKARGFILDVPKGDTIRPTSSRARKAIFDSFSPWKERVILDLFSGSGALGLEAISRGAVKVYFVEKSSQHIRVLEKNIQKVQKAQITFEHSIFQCDVLQYINPPAGVTDIFADPPYPQSETFFQQFIISKFAEKIATKTRLIWEIPDQDTGIIKQFEGNDFWKVERLRNYGSVWFLVLERK